MKSLLYLFRRYKLSTVLNVLGLAVAVAAFYLFMTQVKFNKTYNNCIPAADRTYRLEIQFKQINNGNWGAMVPRPIEVALKKDPRVEQVQSLLTWSNTMDVLVDEHAFSVPRTTMGLPGPQFFGTKLVCGSMEQWGDCQHAVLSKSTAERLFGNAMNALGKQLKDKNGGNDGYPLTVCAVCEDIPDNCTLKNGIFDCYGQTNISSTSEWSYAIFVRLDKAENREAVRKSVIHAMADIFSPGTSDAEFVKAVGLAVRLTPVTDIYFTQLLPDDKGNSNLVNVLLVGAFFVLIVALLNMTNFTLAETPFRMRGINTRKVMGASVASLRWSMVAENMVLGAVAVAVALLLVLAFGRSSYCMGLVSGDIRLVAQWPLALTSAALGIAVSAVAAVFPALYATSFAPALVLKGSFGLTPRGRQMRGALLFVQFVIAFVLVIYVGVMNSQSHYIYQADYGFDKDQVVFASLSQEAMGQKGAIGDALKQLACVKSVAFGSSELGDNDLLMQWGRGSDEYTMSITVVPVDENYLTTMGLTIVKGRNFNIHDSHGAYILNEAAMNKYKWLQVGKPIGIKGGWDDMNYDIVGVCRNFKLYSMRQDNDEKPVLFMIMPPEMQEGWGDHCKKVFVRIDKNFDKWEARQQIASTLASIDKQGTCDFSFLDEKLQQTYEEEFRFINQIKGFAVVCIFITLIGVFCLTMFDTEYRRKEIAIRKVMGSSVGQVLDLFARKQVVPLIGAFIIAAPIGYMLSASWLQSFADHTRILWWIFPLAFVLVSAVVLLTVVAQSWRVATMNPAYSLKTE